MSPGVPFCVFCRRLRCLDPLYEVITFVQRLCHPSGNTIDQCGSQVYTQRTPRRARSLGSDLAVASLSPRLKRERRDTEGPRRRKKTGENAKDEKQGQSCKPESGETRHKKRGGGRKRRSERRKTPESTQRTNEEGNQWKEGEHERGEGK
ncbi:UNVERIFIED_CONTAM: hypothetical protein HHA_451040 [Hammondia hammondi]|eukprot:XP_008883567.1 hypothetical protein HHA_451040 [Hammondia hammondi]